MNIYPDNYIPPSRQLCTGLIIVMIPFELLCNMNPVNDKYKGKVDTDGLIHYNFDDFHIIMTPMTKFDES